jgi:hypothetical protein
MRTTIFTGALVLWLAPAALLGQTPEQRIEAAMQRALQAGVPIELLESKVAEGRAKNVAMERIAAAVEARYTALERARLAMARRGDVTQAELGLGADAMQSGVSEVVLGAIVDRAEGEQRAVAIATLTELVLMGHVPEHALARVTEALSRGPAALMNLPAQARAQQRQGPPAGVPAAGGQTGPRGGPPASVPAPGQGPQGGKPTTPPKPPAGPPGGGM